MNNLKISGEQLKIQVWVFALVMLGLFAVFLVAVPVRSGTPQIFRLRYYALQQGVEGGPLSSSLADFDWRKAFVWRASDTEYRQRQFSQFFEILTPRLYVPLRYRIGPFLWFPFSLLCAFLIGLMIALVVRQWSGEWLPGIVAGSFWLLTTEVLVGHHAPIRYAKDLATLQILGIISLLLAIRGARRGRRNLLIALAGLIWWLGLFTDEYIQFIFPALVVAAFTWSWLKPIRFRLLSIFSLLLAVGFILFWFVLPDVITPDQKEPLVKMVVGEMPSLADKVWYNFSYLILNTRNIFTYTLGWPPPHSPVQTVLASLNGMMLLLLIWINRAWRGWGKMILFWAVATAVVGGVLLPEGTDILHQHTYYNRPLVSLLLVVWGLLTANIFRSGRKRLVSAWLAGLLLVAILNLTTNIASVKAHPYLNKYGAEAILGIHDQVRNGELPVPAFVSYPRHRDAVKGVYRELETLDWHTRDEGSPPWSLYRSLMPRLYIRHFEKGLLRADPRQFSRWKDADPHRYRAAARSFYDLPTGVVWDLESIREAAGPPHPGLTWESDDGREIGAAVIGDLLGPAPAVLLDKGVWRTSLEVPISDSPLAAVIAVRHDGPAALKLSSGAISREIECDYGWSWQLFAIDLAADSSGMEAILETGGEAEVIGPVLVPAESVADLPAHRRENIPPAGISPCSGSGDAPALAVPVTETGNQPNSIR